ncbi:MAG: bifunctional 4-hydroxy-2-oxoglutarate aldolase/2-dehydro-3-deoxy-phosphogluconate aldolase [Candidatus Dadabacteria bacterium]|nr:bifunctional 4-hydroxy-2-oxoglutarate aldolase/2-dehydro-3-deoxy-phosphogluconate aldolase [Candidatus Dadabacteria bacterium]NIT12951.1 bifunctional 4-hydroxy-2-oxoglutarate aldolase/2-dehydro-3-deoxy-phosphogluconate aldolase [Candidatus Dadabacteria bacterium]
MKNLKDGKIVAVIRSDSTEEAMMKAQPCIEGGIKTIEITFSYRRCCDAIRTLKNNKELIVGAGTVLDLKSAQSALDAGADFIVSPHTDADIINFCKKNNITVISGASTSNEIVRAHSLGTNMVKIFPANIIGGPKYVKAIKEPLPFAEVFVTGGINIDNCTEYLSSGASLIGVASALFPNGPQTDEKIIINNARKFVEKIRDI